MAARVSAHSNAKVPLALRPHSASLDREPTARLGTPKRCGPGAHAQQHPEIEREALEPISDLMTRVEYSQRLQHIRRSEAAEQARVDREERRRFAEEQKEKMRMRARELREQQLAANRPMEAIARAASKNTSYRGAPQVSSVRRWHGGHAEQRGQQSGAVHVVALGTMSSMERLEIQKVLQRSPRC